MLIYFSMDRKKKQQLKCSFAVLNALNCNYKFRIQNQTKCVPNTLMLIICCYRPTLEK